MVVDKKGYQTWVTQLPTQGWEGKLKDRRKSTGVDQRHLYSKDQEGQDRPDGAESRSYGNRSEGGRGSKRRDQTVTRTFFPVDVRSSGRVGEVKSIMSTLRRSATNPGTRGVRRGVDSAPDEENVVVLSGPRGPDNSKNRGSWAKTLLLKRRSSTW